jgi:cyanophycinase
MADEKKNNLPECPTPKGILMAIGGKENKGGGPNESSRAENFIKEEVLKTFIGLIEKKDPVVEILTTASSSGSEQFEEYARLFKGLGIEKVGHIHHDSRQEATNDTLTDRVNQADAFFFAGGDQLKLTSIYGGSDFLSQLKKRYIADTIVIGGTSAGAMALSTPMIYAGNKEVQQTNGEIKITTGFEFLKDVCIDTHFVDRARFVRMAQVIASNPTCVGVGVEQDTALVVREGLRAKVVGTGIVTIIEGFHMETTNITEYAEKASLSVRNLKVHLLSRDDEYMIPQMNTPHR